MVKKIKKWRDDLTYEQARAIYSSVLGWILVCSLLVEILSGIVQLKEQSRVYGAIICSSLIGFLVLIVGCVASIPFENFLQLESKKRKKEEQEVRKIYSETFENETEVIYKGKEAPEGDAGEFYWDMKHCKEPHFFAKWQDDKIYVVLKDGDKIVRNWDVHGLLFFKNCFEKK